MVNPKHMRPYTGAEAGERTCPPNASTDNAYTYLHMSIHVEINVCRCIYIYTHIYVYIYTCSYVYIYIYMSGWKSIVSYPYIGDSESVARIRRFAALSAS